MHMFSRKSRSRWTGLFIVSIVYSYGKVVIENLKSGYVFKINGKRLKHFLALPSL